jgi:hypothetical protein
MCSSLEHSVHGEAKLNVAQYNNYTKNNDNQPVIDVERFSLCIYFIFIGDVNVWLGS